MKLFLCLLAVVFAVEDTRFIDFKAIDDDQFGRTLIDTLQVHVQSGAPMDKFVDVMRDMENSIEEELKTDTQLFQEFQKKCDVDLLTIENELNTITLTTTEQQGKLDELENEQALRVQIVNAKKQWLEQLQEQSTRAASLRAQEAEIFQQSISENTYVITVINQVKNQFVKSDFSFIQLDSENSKEIASKVYDNILDAVDETRNFRQQTSYRNVFQLFAQITARVQSNGDIEVIKQLQDLCQQLLFSVEDNMSLLRKQEDKRSDIYDKQKKALDKDLQQLQTDLALNQQLQDSLDDKITQVQSDMANYKQRIEQKSTTQADRKQECQDNSYSYRQSRDDNEKRRQLVSQVIGLFSAKQRDFKDYIHARQ